MVRTACRETSRLAGNLRFPAKTGAFPRFGHALGLYSIMPVRVEGLVIVPALDDSTVRTAEADQSVPGASMFVAAGTAPRRV